MAKIVKDYKNWIDTYENPTESEKGNHINIQKLILKS